MSAAGECAATYEEIGRALCWTPTVADMRASRAAQLRAGWMGMALRGACYDGNEFVAGQTIAELVEDMAWCDGLVFQIVPRTTGLGPGHYYPRRLT